VQGPFIKSRWSHIAIHGSQEAARRAEGNWTDSKAIHNIDGAEASEQCKFRREKVASADQPKPMLLCEDIAEQKVLLGSQLSEEQEKTLIRCCWAPRRTFSSRIFLITMLWLFLALSKGFWSTMSWLIQAVQLMSYLLRPSDKCKSQKIRFMMLHILSVASEEDRL
jgi:hypothetical protein